MTSVFTTTTTLPSDLSVAPLPAPRPFGYMADESAFKSGQLGGGMFFTTDANAAWRPLSPPNHSPG